MNSTNSASAPRKAWLAALLSVGATGLGHLYCGRLTKGLILFFISFAFAPVIINVARISSSSTFMLMVIIVSLVVMFGAFWYGVIDSALLARRLGADYQLKEYNKWFIYLLFVVVAFGYPTNLSFSIRDHVLQAFRIPSTSMAPSILRGDHVFLNKMAYRMSAPKRGDVVIFIYPDGRHMNYLKRIIGLPGETVEIRNNEVLINGVPLVYKKIESHQRDNMDMNGGNEVMMETIEGQNHQVIVDKDEPENMAPVTVAHGHCFLLGDNRPESRDSRSFGPVPLADVKGRVDYIYWPAVSWSRFGRFPAVH